MVVFLRNRLYRKQGKDVVPVHSGPISVTEYAQSLLFVVRIAKNQSFPGVLGALEAGDCHEIDAGKHGVKAKQALTPLRKYCPFLFEGVMRISGRLQKSKFYFD